MTDYPTNPPTGAGAPPPAAAFTDQPIPGQPYPEQAYPAAGVPTFPVSVAQYPVIMLPQHPQAITVLVLGILGYFTFVTAPIAWYLGQKAEKELAQSGQRFANESYIKIGKLLGMTFTIVGALGILATIAYVIFVFSFVMSIIPNFPR